MTFDNSLFEEAIKRLGYKINKSNNLNDIKMYNCSVTNAYHTVSITIDYKNQYSANWKSHIVIHKKNKTNPEVPVRYDILGPEHAVELLGIL